MALNQRKRSFTEDSDESRNESKLAKLTANFWIYLKSNASNLAQFVLKNPKTFEKNLSEIVEGKTLDLSKLKLYLSKGIVRVNCNDEKQQEKCLKIKKNCDIQVTATLPWMLSKPPKLWKAKLWTANQKNQLNCSNMLSLVFQKNLPKTKLKRQRCVKKQFESINS